MIPFIRSFTELMAITHSRDNLINDFVNVEQKNYSENCKQTKENTYSKAEKKIMLPRLPKIERRKWVKSKEAFSKFFDKLDYNNQIQSSLDITLLECNKNYDQKDVA